MLLKIPLHHRIPDPESGYQDQEHLAVRAALPGSGQADNAAPVQNVHQFANLFLPTSNTQDCDIHLDKASEML